MKKNKQIIPPKAIYGIIFLGFLSFFRSQGEWEKKKNQKKYFDNLYKKKHFYLLNTIHHGNKREINNSIFEHKAMAATQCSDDSELPSSVAR